MNCERTITTLNEQHRQLNNEFRIKQEDFHQIEKSLNKQVITSFFSQKFLIKIIVSR